MLLLVDQPPEVQAEIIRINTEARPFALQVALLIPIFASLHRFRDLAPDDASARSGLGRDRRTRARLTARRT